MVGVRAPQRARAVLRRNRTSRHAAPALAAPGRVRAAARSRCLAGRSSSGAHAAPPSAPEDRRSACSIYAREESPRSVGAGARLRRRPAAASDALLAAAVPVLAAAALRCGGACLRPTDWSASCPRSVGPSCLRGRLARCPGADAQLPAPRCFRGASLTKVADRTCFEPPTTHGPPPAQAVRADSVLYDVGSGFGRFASFLKAHQP